VRSDDSPPLLERISDYVAWYAERWPRQEALVLGARRIDYSQLAGEVDALSRSLLAAGVRRGDRVATLAPPHPDFFIVFLAAVSIGAIWVGLNPRYQRGELEFVLTDSRPTLVFARTRIGTRDYAGDIAALQSALPTARWVVLGDDPVPAGGIPYLDYIAASAGIDVDELAQARAAVRAADAALIVYTSGSTGQPKGALLPHRGLTICCKVQHRFWGTDPLRTLNFFPINHIGCVGDIACFTLVAGGCTVFLEQFSSADCLHLIAAERVTLWAGVPTTFLLALRDPLFAHADLSSVEKIVWSGAAASAELVDALIGLGKWLGTSYGLTETVGSITYSAKHASRSSLIRQVGSPPPEYSVRIVDDAGRPVKAGEIGEIQVRGDFLMIGYWERPEATAEAFEPGDWFKTGDLAGWSADGNIELAARRKEVFKSGGYNVYPREVEQVMERYKGVHLAAVVAVPDPVFGNVGHAFVVPEPHATLIASELDQHARRHLANYKVPKSITVTLDLPMLPIGKIDKRTLAVRAAAGSTPT
jgi:acyl-CoA synthetase (AMP-forming)/AMP-acid ligase II